MRTVGDEDDEVNKLARGLDRTSSMRAGTVNVICRSVCMDQHPKYPSAQSYKLVQAYPFPTAYNICRTSAVGCTLLCFLKVITICYLQAKLNFLSDVVLCLGGSLDGTMCHCYAEYSTSRT
jgi:hypothetical protein